MSLSKEIDLELSRHGADADPHEVAKSLVKRLSKKSLLSLIAEEVAHRQRGVVRGIEREAFRSAFVQSSDRGGVQMSELLHPSDKERGQFRSLLTERFSIGGSQLVSWGEATVEQHEQRIAMLEKMRDGIDSTIQKHRDIVRELQQSGAACLNELAMEKAA